MTSDSVTLGSGSSVEGAILKLGYAFDDAGMLSSSTSYNASGGVVNQIVDTFDGFKRLISEAQEHAGNVSSGSPTVVYSRDGFNSDRLTARTDVTGQTINYNYNGSGGLDSILGRISSVSDSVGTIQAYGYMGLDTPVTFADGNGVTLSYLGTTGSTSGDAGDQYTGLDRFGRIIDQKWTHSSTTVDEFKYGYDADSNVLYRNNTVLTGQSELYAYDNLNRLTNFSSGAMNISGGVASIASPTHTQTWALDALGNWNNNTVDGTSTSRTNSAQNQIKTVGSATLNYDANGNTLKDNTGQQYK